MRITGDQLKDTIANGDFEVQIANSDFKTIFTALSADGYTVNYADIMSVVFDLQANDPYFVRTTAKFKVA
jgi:hypothetical protein